MERMRMSTQERAAKTETNRKESFDKWLSRDETKLIVSLLPASEPPEALYSLLRSAFSSGFDSGASDIASMMIEGMFASMKEGPHG